jgi:hypothetical protein
VEIISADDDAFLAAGNNERILIIMRKIHAVGLALVLVAGVLGFSGSAPAPSRAAGGPLLSLLPASDFVLYCDAGQALNVVLPALLAQRPEWQAKIDRDFGDFQRDTGIDPRSFESVAVGVRFKSGAGGSDPSFVVIARGSFNADAAIDGAFAAQAKKAQPARIKREIEYGGRTIFVAARATTGNDAKGKSDGDRELAALVFDPNTIAFGDLAGMRAVVDATNGKGRVDDELIALATRTPGALAGFAGSIPGDIPNLFVGGHGGDNEIGQAINGIRQIYGSVSSSGTDCDARVTLRTENADQSRNLGQMINALKLLTKASNNTSRRTAEDLVRDLNVSVAGNEVDLTVRASLADLVQISHRF